MEAFHDVHLLSSFRIGRCVLFQSQSTMEDVRPSVCLSVCLAGESNRDMTHWRLSEGRREEDQHSQKSIWRGWKTEEASVRAEQRSESWAEVQAFGRDSQTS